MKRVRLVPIQDQFWENREAYSEFLNIYCEKCGNYLLTYQKDGPGELRRMYLDRIHAPEELTNLNEKDITSDLVCPHCDRIIAAPRTYKKENRKSYFIFAYSVIELKGDGMYPPKVSSIEVD